MDKTADDLKNLYSADDRPITNETINQYEQTIYPKKLISIN